MGRLVSFDRVSKLHGAKESFEVPGKYIMVIGEKTPVVTLYERTSD
jgi:hypothetical protein